MYLTDVSAHLGALTHFCASKNFQLIHISEDWQCANVSLLKDLSGAADDKERTKSPCHVFHSVCVRQRAVLFSSRWCTNIYYLRHRQAAVKAGKSGLHHAVTVYPQRACYQHSTGMNVLSMQITRPHAPLLSCLLSVCSNAWLLINVSMGIQSADSLFFFLFDQSLLKH